MARSSYIYIVVKEDGQIDKGFTVKRECIIYLLKSGKAPDTWKVYTCADGNWNSNPVDSTKKIKQQMEKIMNGD